jgi:hypothetical protein
VAGLAGVVALVAAVVVTGRLIDLPGPGEPGSIAGATTVTTATSRNRSATTQDLRVITIELDPAISGLPGTLRIPPEGVSCTRHQGRTLITGSVPSASGGQHKVMVALEPFEPGVEPLTAEIDLELDRSYRLRVGGSDTRAELHRRNGASGELVGSYSEVDAAGRPVRIGGRETHTGHVMVSWWCGRIETT